MAPKLKLAHKKPATFPANSTFPWPEHALVKDSSATPGRAAEFFRYWKELAGTISEPNERADLIEARFYLHLPKISLKLADPTRRNNVFQSFTGPMWFEDPDNYLEEIPRKLGAGRWMVCLNETGIRGELMKAYFAAGDWDENPPQVDLRTLLHNDPANEDYIRWLKKTGAKLPWDNPQEEEEEMQGEIVKTLLDTVKEQSSAARESDRELAEIRVAAAEEEADRARQEAEEAREKVRKEEVQVASMEGYASKASVDMLAHAGMKSIDMITAHAGSQHDPILLMKTVAEIVRPTADSGIALMVEALKDTNSKMSEMQTRNFEFLGKVIGMNRNPDGSWNAPQQPQQQSGGFEVELTRFKNLADIMGWKRPDSATIAQSNPEPYREPKRSFWDGIAENPIPALTAISTIVTLLANVAYNFTAGKSAPVPPAEALAKSQQQPQPAPQPQQQAARNPKDPASWAGLPQHIENSLRMHLLGKDAGLNGFTFAEFLLGEMTAGAPTAKGRQWYNSIRENLGPDNFTRLLVAHPPIAELQRSSPESFQQFIFEFFGYDEHMEKQAAAA